MADTPDATDCSTTLRVPIMLFNTASEGLISINGTCLCAAAWKITSGR